MTTLAKLIKWVLILAMPFLISSGIIRAVIAWDYPAWEYGRIPADQYGWSPEERLDLAQATLAYMRRPEPANEAIHLLEELQLPERAGQPLYNEREIEHMLDVKRVADQLKNVFWVLSAVTIIAIFFFLSQSEIRTQAYDLLYRGGLTTVIALVGIGGFIVIGWQTFFVLFHEIFFPPGTWTFFYTDSLIRLFPEQFWFDVGVLIVGGTLAVGVLLAVLGYILRRGATR